MKFLLADPVALKLGKVIPQADEIIVVVETARTKAVCPNCQMVSTKLHSRYERRLADLPWAGIAVWLHLRTRKFFCLNNGQVEGQINRLKMLKRQMYGRAGIDLLRQRVLHPT